MDVNLCSDHFSLGMRCSTEVLIRTSRAQSCLKEISLNFLQLPSGG